MSEKGEAAGNGDIASADDSGPGDAEETMGQVVRTAEATNALVKRYEAAGLISSRRDPYGRRLFPKGTGERVRKLKAERLARLGRKGGAEQVESVETAAPPPPPPAASAASSEGASQSERAE